MKISSEPKATRRSWLGKTSEASGTRRTERQLHAVECSRLPPQAGAGKRDSLIRSLLVALFCLSIAGFTGAQDKKMYSWTDENGTVHFSDTLPEGQAVRELDVPEDPAPAADNPYQQSNTGPSAADFKRAEIARKSDENQINKALTGAQCSSWQQELARLEPNRRVFYTNEEGETVRMDDVKRTDRVAELKSQIARSCK